MPATPYTMNKAQKTALRAALLAGDCPAALAILDNSGRPAARVREVKPMPYARKGAASRVKKLIPPKEPLAVAACGCTLYPDTALQCPEHEAARDPGPCRALIAAHAAALDAWDRRMGFSAPQTGRDWMIAPHNNYYGARTRPTDRG